jgi:hypothetical protein
VKDCQPLEKILYRINNTLVFPENWRQEGVQEPNAIAKENAFATCNIIFRKDGLLPLIIAPTKEEGIFLKYTARNKTLIIEAYNDGDIAAVVSDEDQKIILYSEDIKNFNFENTMAEFLKDYNV